MFAWLVFVGFVVLLAVWLGMPARVGQAALGVVCLLLLLALLGVFGERVRALEPGPPLERTG